MHPSTDLLLWTNHHPLSTSSLIRPRPPPAPPVTLLISPCLCQSFSTHEQLRTGSTPQFSLLVLC